MTALAHEDSLRLHVLLKNVEAVRIDESAMVVYGLADNAGSPREAKVTLNPNCRPEQYLRRVREFLSGVVLGSPGGYPVHLNRWTRMGQAKDTNLAELLMLGEPEAVTAVSGAPGLTDALAQRVWWAAPTSEHARRMLERAGIARGPIGPILARHLVEHLPFETDARLIIDTVRLVVQPGLVGDDVKQRLWTKGEKQTAYRAGFLQAIPDDLPHRLPPRVDLSRHRNTLAALARDGNDLAGLLLKTGDGPGQAFLETARHLLDRPMHHDVIATALNTIGIYFHTEPRPDGVRDIHALVAHAADACDRPQTRNDNGTLASLLRAAPDLTRNAAALLVLSGVREDVVVDILAHTTATGTVLRRRLEPVTSIIRDQLDVLRGDT